MPVDVPSYPVNLLVAGRRVLVVGGGAVAAEKARGLLAAGAIVHVVATEVRAPVRALEVTWEERPYARGDVRGYRLVVACTDDPAANQAVFDDGEAADIWVNAADDPARCSYTLPARLDRGRLLVTVSTAGHSPALASWLRDQLGEHLGPEYDTLLELLADARAARVTAGLPALGADWRSALDSGMLDLVRAGRIDEARELLETSLAPSDPPHPGSLR
ncbi:MAG: bifunctional precorrin-2 dehydrogenase/sirohydrochlorin ferrochelatase [Acidimicrobiales bacterium]